MPNPDNPVRLLIVEDHAFFRSGLRQYLTGEGYTVAEAGDAASALSLAQTQTFDAAIVDIVLPSQPGMPARHTQDTGLRLMQTLKELQPDLALVILSSHPDRAGVFFDWVQAGWRGLGYLLKDGQPEHLLDALREVLAGRVVFDHGIQERRAIADELLQRLTPDERHWVEAALQRMDQLTEREREAARQVADSYDTRAAAEHMRLQPKTVENLISQVYARLGLDRMSREAPHLRQNQILAKACLIDNLQKGQPL